MAGRSNSLPLFSSKSLLPVELVDITNGSDMAGACEGQCSYGDMDELYDLDWHQTKPRMLKMVFSSFLLTFAKLNLDLDQGSVCSE